MTVPPIPPSDNLYKFTAIGGLILAVLSLYVPQQLLTQHTLSVIEIDSELEKVKSDKELFGREVETSAKFSNATMKMLENVLVRMIFRFEQLAKAGQVKALEGEEETKLVLEQYRIVKDDLLRINEKKGEIQHRSHQFASEKEKLTYLKSQLDTLFWTSVVTFFVGVIMMVFGFWNWYFRFQIYQDRIVKAQAAQWTKPQLEPDRDEIPG